MCLSNVFYIDLDGEQQEIMRDVAQMEAHNNGYLLTGLLGEQKFVQGDVRTIDFIDKHSVVIGINGINTVNNEQLGHASF